MKLFAEFYNSDLYHIMDQNNNHTLCSITVVAAGEFTEYAETNYPLPNLVETPSPDRTLCSKCAEKQK